MSRNEVASERRDSSARDSRLIGRGPTTGENPPCGKLTLPEDKRFDKDGNDRSVMQIHLTDTRPFQERGGRRSLIEDQYLEAQAKRWLWEGVCRRSLSPWASRVLFVKKKNGKVRTCVDFRTLNRHTVKVSGWAPRPDNTLELLHTAKIVSALDTVGAYHTIALSDDAAQYTAFDTPMGRLEFCRAIEGLHGSLAYWTRACDAALEDVDPATYTRFVDDLFVLSQDETSHVEHLRASLMALGTAAPRIQLFQRD